MAITKNGDLEYYLIPESVGRNPGSVDFSLDTKGIKALIYALRLRWMEKVIIMIVRIRL